MIVHDDAEFFFIDFYDINDFHYVFRLEMEIIFNLFDDCLNVLWLSEFVNFDSERIVIYGF